MLSLLCVSMFVVVSKVNRCMDPSKDFVVQTTSHCGDSTIVVLVWVSSSSSCTTTSISFKFLRSDYFDPSRLARHFDYKLEPFGKELLCKDIKQDDLYEGSLKCFYSGLMQQLPVRDTSGHLVTVGFPRIEGCSDVSNLQKVSNQ